MIRAASAAVALPLLFAATVAGQTRVPDAPSCPRCEIKLRRVATIGTVDGAGALPASSALKVDGAGRYWVLHPPDLPQVFDSAGRALSSPFRRGSGPGEFPDTPSPYPLPGDSTLAILAPGSAVVLGPDLRYARTVSTSHIMIGAVLLRWPDRVFVNGYAMMRAQGFEPLALVSFSGGRQTTLKLFGTHPGEPLSRPDQVRRAMVKTGENVWVAEPRRYRLTEWNPDGTIARVLDRKPDWFDEKRTDFGGPRQAPPEMITALSVDQRGLLWVFINVAAPTWREAWPKIPEGAREIRSDLIRHDKRYHTIIEVIDPAAGRLVARRKFEDYITTALPGGKAAIYYVDADDIPHYSIIALTLDRYTRR